MRRGGTGGETITDLTTTTVHPGEGERIGPYMEKVGYARRKLEPNRKKLGISSAYLVVPMFRVVRVRDVPLTQRVKAYVLRCIGDDPRGSCFPGGGEDTKVLQTYYEPVTTDCSICGIHSGTYFDSECVFRKELLKMETDLVTEESVMTARKDRTLRTLFQVICQDDEFSLLNETLRLYLEEIGRQTEGCVD